MIFYAEFSEKMQPILLVVMSKELGCRFAKILYHFGLQSYQRAKGQNLKKFH